MSRWIALFVALCSAYACAEVAKGTVYDDRNGNGFRDADEPGLPNVCVSNGKDVVRTGDDGSWVLPVTDDTIVFVVKPSGWATPLSEDMLPRFYYIHKPNGSPELPKPGVAPTGPLPPSIDCPLIRRDEPSTFRILLFGDTQARGLREVNFITRDVVEELVGADVAFGVSLGDIVADDVLLFEPINRAIAQIGVPWHNVFGNHDHNGGPNDDRTSDEAFERVYGPGTYAFEYGGVSFIIIDDVYFKPEGGYEGRLTDPQNAFFKGYLDTVPRERLVVLMMHIPILRLANREPLYDLLKDRPHTFSISAHAHEQMQFFLTREQGWKGEQPHHHLVHATVSGSWWCGTFDENGIPHATMNDGAPNGYSYVTFDGNRYSVRFKAARRPDDYQMNVYAPDELERSKSGETEVLVNVFAGSERSTVEMRLDRQGGWTRLEQTRTTDPECARMHEQSKHMTEELEHLFGWKMDPPSMTSHMWKGTLPPDLTPGTHTIEVRTTDLYGQSYTAYRVIRVL